MKIYTADPELTALLKEAAEAGEPLRVRTDDSTYELEVRKPAKKDIWKDYDPEAVREALEASFGILREIDADAWIERIRADREQDTPGRPAWWRTD